MSDSSPAWERIEDSIGLVANATHDGSAVQNDFDNIYPWSDIISYNYNTTTKKITAYYGDATFKFDGSNGEVLTRIPEFWIKRYQDTEYEYIYITKEQKEGYTQIEEFSVGRYIISGSSSGVHSKNGVTPLANTTITDFRTYAKNIGTGFGIMDWRYFVLQLLYLVEYANYNSQLILGSGYTSGTMALISSGGCDLLGMKSGCLVNDSKHSVIYRGIEDMIGVIWEFIDGINIKNAVSYVCYDPTKYAVGTFSGDYKALSYTNGSSTNFISKLGYDSNNPLIAFPIEVNGSTSTYMCDIYAPGDISTIFNIGGAFFDSSNAGFWCIYSSKSDYSTNFVGCRLLKYN